MFSKCFVHQLSRNLFTLWSSKKFPVLQKLENSEHDLGSVTFFLFQPSCCLLVNHWCWLPRAPDWTISGALLQLLKLRAQLSQTRTSSVSSCAPSPTGWKSSGSPLHPGSLRANRADDRQRSHEVAQLMPFQLSWQHSWKSVWMKKISWRSQDFRNG